jgi:hypothetical protein
MQINRGDVLAEVTEQFLRYEKAINTNDIAVLDSMFHDSAHTVRFGMKEELWSYDEIKTFRRTPNTAGTPRQLVKYVITAYGNQMAVANAVFRREGVHKIGRQSQTWVKFEDGWKVVSAHVSLAEIRQDPNPSGGR